MNTYELCQYYAKLLVLQYIGKPKAYATVLTQVTPAVLPQTSTQTIVFSPAPSSGAFTLVYDTTATASINWNDSVSIVQTKLQAITALAAVTVTGSIADGLLVTFTGVNPPALILTVGTNTIDSGAPVITETDVTLPISVQNGFNILAGTDIAQGVQLDVIGKYVGVSRTSAGFTTQITLDDSDFTSLIQIATVENSAGSSTADIVGLLNQFFPNQIFLFDRQTMEFDYYISQGVGSFDLIQVFITEGLLPKPMGVRIRLIIYAPVINTFFGYRTYQAPAYNASPFNSYTDYHTDYPWLSYVDAIII